MTMTEQLPPAPPETPPQSPPESPPGSPIELPPQSPPETAPEPPIVNKNPAARYSVPQDVLDDDRLSHAQKARRLAEWALDLSDRTTATAEGMAPPPKDDRAEKHAALLDRIVQAQAKLASQAGDAGNSTT